MRSLRLLLPVLLLALLCGPASGQWRTLPLSADRQSLESRGADTTASRSKRFGDMLLPAAAGSVVGVPIGFMAGLVLYETTGCCFQGGDDPGLSEAALGAVVGASLGSAMGAYVGAGRERPVSFGRALAGAAIGFVPAAYLGAYTGEATNGFFGFAVFGLTQGAATAAFAW